MCRFPFDVVEFILFDGGGCCTDDVPVAIEGNVAEDLIVSQ